jgi:hypothetical protein
VLGFRMSKGGSYDGSQVWRTGTYLGRHSPPFGVGRGLVVAIDEWERVEQLQALMANPELQAFIVQTGGTGSPGPMVTEAVDSPDSF